MKIKLVTGATAYEACINTLKHIDVLDYEKENMVVVPDTFSMQAESLIFDVLKTKTFFNIKVVGISKLAGQILRDNNVAYQRISGLEEVFCIYQAVKEVEKDFKYFHKCDVSYCIKILQIIKQFKSCKIKPEQIKNVGEDMLDSKMHDLKLIYSKYQELLGEKMDLSKMLDFFVENAENYANLTKYNLFFVNFDSFSLEIGSFICKFASLVNCVYIGMAKAISPNNAFIYENDIKSKTMSLAKLYSVNVEVENNPTKISDEKLKIVKNLFAFDVEKGESDYFVNVLAKNKQDEIEFVAKYIKHQITNNNAKFKDFSLVVSDKNYYDKIRNVFQKYDISLYCDDAVDLSQTVIGNFLKKIIEIAKLGFDKEKLEYLVDNKLLEKENKSVVLNDIFVFNVEDEKEFLERFPEYETLIGLIKKLKLCKKIKEYAFVLKEILKMTETNYQQVLQMLEDDLFFKKQSENVQAKELIEKILDKLTELGQNEIFELSDFENILELSFKSVKVETIPSYIDAVFVGEASTSYFEDVETLFVLGATANALPHSQSDIGIIDDEDIKKLKLNFALEPEIKVLNRRSRLKLFECLQHANKKLIVCSPLVVDDKQTQVSGFVNDLRTMFGNNIILTSSLEDIDLPILSKQEKLNKLLFYIGCKNNLLSAYSQLKADGKLPKNFASALYSVLKTSVPEQEKYKQISSDVADKILFQKGVVSASQLESYFSCPFRHLMTYGLNIKQRENIEPNKRLFGIFQHALLQKFVAVYGENLQYVDDKIIIQFLQDNVEVIAKNIYDKKVLEKKYFVKYLKNEAKIILKNVAYEQQKSAFRPFLLEEKIYTDFVDKLKLIGYVDRADCAGNYFRIFDYKTGRTENIKKDLFYGKKLQLFLYGNSMQTKLKKKCAGVYYFDCQTKYTKTNSNANLLNGITLKDNSVVLMTDRELEQYGVRSKLVGMTQKKNVKDDEFAFRYGNTTEDFDFMFDYASKVSKNAIKEIGTGYVEDKPLKGECQFCPYQTVCKHRDQDGFRQMNSIKDEDLKRNSNGN